MRTKDNGLENRSCQEQMLWEQEENKRGADVMGAGGEQEGQGAGWEAVWGGSRE